MNNQFTDWVREFIDESLTKFGAAPTEIVIGGKLWDKARLEVNLRCHINFPITYIDPFVLEIWTRGGLLKIRKAVCKECGQ